jgi:hypothetical protein
VVADAFDTLANCEGLNVSRALMPDVDNDGVPAPADCNDQNAAIRPGLPDRPGDGIDEDCSGRDATFPRVLTGVSGGWNVNKAFLRFTKLELIDVPDQATVVLSCRGRGCFKAVKPLQYSAGAPLVKLTRNVARAKLRPRAVVEVRILRTDTVGKVVRYTVRKGKQQPLTSILCLRPGTTTPQSCG